MYKQICASKYIYMYMYIHIYIYIYIYICLAPLYSHGVCCVQCMCCVCVCCVRRVCCGWVMVYADQHLRVWRLPTTFRVHVLCLLCALCVLYVQCVLRVLRLLWVGHGVCG